MKNNKNILIAVGVLIVAVVAVFLVTGGNFGSDSGPVAVVNGEEITRQDFNFVRQQLEQTFSMSGQEVSDEQIDQSAVDQLVATELMVQQANEEGLSVAESEIDEQYQSVISQAGGQDALNQALENLDLTEDYIREDIREQLLIQKYVAQVSEDQDFAATDQEVSDYYDQVDQSQENAPAFSEVESQIRTQLSQQKENQFISTIVSDLRENAEIEILL